MTHRFTGKVDMQVMDVDLPLIAGTELFELFACPVDQLF